MAKAIPNIGVRFFHTHRQTDRQTDRQTEKKASSAPPLVSSLSSVSLICLPKSRGYAETWIRPTNRVMAPAVWSRGTPTPGPWLRRFAAFGSCCGGPSLSCKGTSRPSRANSAEKMKGPKRTRFSLDVRAQRNRGHTTLPGPRAPPEAGDEIH